MVSSEHSPYAGIPSASLIAFAVTMPTRSPVKGPGPRPTAIALRSCGCLPAVTSTSLISGASSSP